MILPYNDKLLIMYKYIFVNPFFASNTEVNIASESIDSANMSTTYNYKSMPAAFKDTNTHLEDTQVTLENTTPKIIFVDKDTAVAENVITLESRKPTTTEYYL